MTDSFQIVAKTLGGLEHLLAEELAALGAERIQTGSRLVHCRGDQRLLYRANLWCRTAIRLLKPIHAFTASNESALYEGVQAADWRQYLDTDSSLAIDPIVRSSFCTHSLYAAQLAKDAIVDQFRARTGRRPSVDLDDPGLRIHLYMYRNQVTLFLDSSGDSLHLRGYRAEAVEAPLNEVLAAGLVRLSGWDGSGTFFDPMCGSGTLVIEAAQRARNIAPGLLRHFAFERWRDYDRALHAAIVAEAETAKRDSPARIVGSDRDERAVAIARQNLRRAGLADGVVIELADFFDRPVPPAPGTLVMNPPYDERIAVRDVVQLYRRIGDTLKRRYAGYTAFLFTGNLEAARHIGLRTSRRVVLFNGPIECRLLRYEMHAASPGRTEVGPERPCDVSLAGRDSAARDSAAAVAGRDFRPSEAATLVAVPTVPSPRVAAGPAGQLEMLRIACAAWAATGESGRGDRESPVFACTTATFPACRWRSISTPITCTSPSSSDPETTTHWVLVRSVEPRIPQHAPRGPARPIGPAVRSGCGNSWKQPARCWRCRPVRPTSSSIAGSLVAGSTCDRPGPEP
jgi:putative N6-adenine-specific DNA methylase